MLTDFARLIAALSVCALAACNPAASLVSSSDDGEGTPSETRWGVVEYPAGSADKELAAARRREAHRIMRMTCYPRNYRVVERGNRGPSGSVTSIRFECGGTLTAAEQDEYWTERFADEITEEDVILSAPN